MLVLAIVALIVPLGLSLRDRVDAEVRLQARSQAEVVAARAAPLMSPPRSARLALLARDAALDVRGRVLIVDSAGRVLADSAGTESVGAAYRNRPEIAGALAGEVTQETRSSQTLGESILATAVPVPSGGTRPAGAVRVTQSVASVNRAIRRTWLGLAAIALLVLGLGLVAGAVIARRIARPIVKLDEAAERVAGGDLSARAAVEGTTEQQALARTFNAMAARLELLLAAQREFVADASHQLRTPLSGLRLRLEEAREQATGDTQAEDLDAALGEVDRLALIVAELLELSRAGEDSRAPATTSLAAAVARVGERFGAPAASAGCELRCDPGDEPAPLVACHESDLDRILDVLIENAIAYAPGAPIEVSAKEWEIVVRDHGPGPADGEQEAAFERFRRGAAARSAGVPGTGLGLPIARELARRWGGDVTLESAPGGGALARVQLSAAGFAGSSPDGA